MKYHVHWVLQLIGLLVALSTSLGPFPYVVAIIFTWGMVALVWTFALAAIKEAP